MTRIRLQYFVGCPTRETTDRMLSALGADG